ncbi:MAG: hypothetical protein EKK32_15875 [Bradyrhizobiaceae bacterium]|nr:MAG: hypothetical protein EKK32_15875 [Bradyrhizobiaceae bacterium]
MNGLRSDELAPIEQTPSEKTGAACATSPRPSRGEVGLRSNPGEGHGTYDVTVAAPSESCVGGPRCTTRVAAHPALSARAKLVAPP